MKKIILTIALGTIMFSSNILVLAQPVHAVQKAAGETIKVKVKGFFCDLCRTKMQKTFGKISGVQKVNVNLESGFVTIRMDKGKTLTNKVINKIVRDTGYTPVSINRR